MTSEKTPHTESLRMTAEEAPTVSAGGVPDGNWYVAIVKRNSEKTCRDKLKEEGYEAYVATQTIMRRYAKRRPQSVEYVRIPAKVFLRLKPFPMGNALSKFFESHPYISSFMLDIARKKTDSHRLAYAVIRDSEIQVVREILGDTENEVLFGFPDESYTIGEGVKAVRGPLRGYEGTLAHKSGKSYLCVEIKGLDWARVQISTTDIAPLGKPK